MYGRSKFINFWRFSCSTYGRIRPGSSTRPTDAPFTYEPGRGEALVGRVVVVDGQADLLEVVLALQPGRGLADLLDGGEQQPDQDRDDGDHDEQLDQGETHFWRMRHTSWMNGFKK